MRRAGWSLLLALSLFLAACAGERKDEGPRVAQVRMQVDYWDSASRSFLPLRRLFRGDTDWKKGINTELIFVVPEGTAFQEDPSDLTDVLAKGLVDQGTSTISLTLPLETPIKLFAYRYVENLALAIAQGGEVYYDSYGESNSLTITSSTNQQSVTIFLTPNGTPGVAITDASGNSLSEGKTTESPISSPIQVGVKLTKKPKSNVSVPLSSSDATEGTVTPASLTFTRSNWDAAQTITITGGLNTADTTPDSENQEYTINLGAIDSEDLDYSGQTFTLPMVNVDLTNVDLEFSESAQNLITSESEDYRTTTFTVQMLRQPTASVSWSLTSSDTTEGTVSPATLDFTTQDWSSPKTVTLTGQDDAVDEKNVEGGPNIEYQVVFGAAQSSDENYSGLQPAPLTAVNLDDDTAKLLITPIAARKDSDTVDASSLPARDPYLTLEVQEGASDSATFEVSLQTQPTDNVTVKLQRVVNTSLLQTFTHEGIGLLPNQQAAILSGGDNKTTLDLTFTAQTWSAPQTITIRALDDDIEEGGDNNPSFPESYQYEEFLLSNTQTNDLSYQNLKRAIRVFASDDDQRGVRVASSANASVQQYTYQISLNSRPIGSVTLSLSLTGAGSLDNTTLTFTPENWNVAQTVTVTPSSLGTDGYSYGDQGFQLNVALVGSDGSGYDDVADSLLFQTDNRSIQLQDDRQPLLDNATVSNNSEILGVGGTVKIRLYASEPLNIPDPDGVALRIRTGTGRTDNATLTTPLESNGSLPNAVLAFSYTVKEGDDIGALTIDGGSALSGVIQDTGAGQNVLALDNATAHLTLSDAPQLDGVDPVGISVSIAGGALATRGNGAFYGAQNLQDNITLTLSASDSSGVTGYYAALDNTSFASLNGTEPGWISLINPDNDSVSFDLGSGSDNKTVHVAFKDNATPANISWGSDSIAIAPRLLSSHPDNASTEVASRLPLRLKFNKAVDALGPSVQLAGSVSITPGLPGEANPVVFPGATYADNSTAFFFPAQALPDNGTTYTVTVHDNLTDVDGVSGVDNLSFTFTTVDLQSSLIAYYSLDNYSTPDQGADNLSLGGISNVTGSDRYGNPRGAISLDNQTISFSNLSGSYSVSLWVTGTSGTVMGFSPEATWRHLVVLDNGSNYVDGQPGGFASQVGMSGFTGTLDEVRVFSERLSPAQVQELFSDPQRGLVAYYPFTGGSLVDFTGKSDNLSGSPTFVAHVHGEASAARGTLTTPNFSLGDNHTLAFWLKPDNGLNDVPALRYTDNASGTTREDLLRINDSTGEWSHWVIVQAEGERRTYVYGERIDLSAQTNTFNGSFQFGSDNITLDEIRIYERPLSAEEALAVMGVRDVQAPSGGFTVSSTIAADLEGFSQTSNLNLALSARDDWQVSKAWFGESPDNLSQSVDLPDNTTISVTEAIQLQDNVTEGLRNFYLRYEDSAGLRSPMYTDELSLDLFPPYDASVKVLTDGPQYVTDYNSGDDPLYTNSRSVLLNLHARDNVSIVGYVADPASDNSSDSDNASVGPVAVYDNASVPYTFPDSVAGNGVLNVTVTYSDGVLRTVSASDNITLDTQRPVGSVKVLNSRSAVKSTDNLTFTLEATDVLSGVWAWTLQPQVGGNVPVLPADNSTFILFSSPGSSVSENVTQSVQSLVGDNVTDNLTFYAWFLDRAGNLSSSLATVAPASDYDNSTGGANDNTTVDNAFDRLYVDSIPPWGSVHFDNLTNFDNTTVHLSVTLNDDHGLHSYWKSNSPAVPEDNATACSGLNLQDDDSDCWQVLTDNSTLLAPPWPDSGLTTLALSELLHTLPTDNFTSTVYVFGKDLAGNVALIQSQTIELNPIAITTNDNFSVNLQESFSISDNQTSEGGDNITLRIRVAHIKPPGIGNVQVDLALSDQTEAVFAASNTAAQVLTFDNDSWDQEQTVIITGVDDSIDDDNKTYELTWSVGLGVSPKWDFSDSTVDVVRRRHQLENIDDDEAGYELVVTDNTTSEGGDTGWVTLRLNTLPFITGSDTASRLNGSGATVRVKVTSDNLSEATIDSVAGASEKTLEFSSTTWNTPQTVTLYGNDVDELDEGVIGPEDDFLSGEFTVTASLVNVDANVQDDKYADGAQDNQTVSLWNTDTDTAGVVVTSIDNNSKESGDNGTFLVRLRSRPFDSLTVHLAADNSTFLEATRGIHLVPDALVFTGDNASWQTEQTVQVVSYDDALDEGEYGPDNQTFNVWLKQVTPTAPEDANQNDDRKFRDNLTALRYLNTDFDNLSLASLDNDTAGVVIASIDNSSAENGTRGKLQVRLQSRPFNAVRVYLGADNDSGRGIELEPGFVDFDNSSGNWSTSQLVEVASIDDSFDEGAFGPDNQTFLIWLDNVTNTGSDGFDQKFQDNLSALIVSGTDFDTLTLASLDNDTAGVVVVGYDNSSSEDQSDQGSLSLRLGSRPYGNIVVHLQVLADNLSHALDLSPDNLTFDNSSDNWSTPQQIIVSSKDDDVDEGLRGPDNQTFHIALDNITVDPALPLDAKYHDDVVLGQQRKLVSAGELVDNLTALSLDNDTARVQLVASDDNASESGDNATVTIRLESEPYHAVTVRIGDNTSTYELGLDNDSGVVPDFLVFGPDNWSTGQVFTLVAEEDDYDEGAFGPDNQTFNVSLNASISADALYNGDNATAHSDNVTILVEDNDTAGVVVASYADNSSSEDGTDHGSLTIRLQSRPFADLTVYLRILAPFLEHALNLSPASLNFDNSSDNWSTPQTVTIASLDDAVDEGGYGHDNQTFHIALDNVTAQANPGDLKYGGDVTTTRQLVHSGIRVDNLTALSLDNDTMGVVIVGTDNHSSENGTLGRLLVKLRSEPYDNVTIFLESDNGTSTFYDGSIAEIGLYLSRDNVTLDNTSIVLVEFAPSGSGNWSEYQTVWVQSIDDAVDEGTLGPDNQTFNVWVHHVDVDNTTADLLYDNDSLAQSQINLNTLGNLTDNLTLVSADNDTARVLLSYGDNVSTEDGGSGDFTVRLQTQPLDNVTVFFTDNDTSGRLLGLRFTPDNLTFTGSSGNWSMAQTVVFNARDDHLDEGELGPDNQTFTAWVHDALSGDPLYHSDNGTAVSDNLTGLVATDNDTAGVVVLASDNRSYENGTTGTLLVRLQSEPYGQVSLKLAADNRTHTLDGADFPLGIWLSPDNLSFAADNWSTVQTVTLHSFDDQVDEGALGIDNQTTFWVRLESLDDDNASGMLYDNISAARINLNTVENPVDNFTVVSTDNDTARVILVYGDNDSAESGDNGSFTVRLQTQPLDNVTVFLTDNDTSGRLLGLQFTPDQLVFNSSASDNWSVAKPVVFSARDDQVDEGGKGLDNQTFTAWVDNVSSTDPRYSGDNGTAVSDNLTGLVATDNDTVGVIIVATDNRSYENGTTGTLLVRLRSEPYGNVTVKLLADNDSQTLGAQSVTLGVALMPDTLVFASGNWSTAQTVEVESLDDLVDEGDRGPDNQTAFWVKLGSLDDDNASGMLYDNISVAQINLNTVGTEVDNFTVVSTDNDSAGLNASTSGYAVAENESQNATLSLSLNSMPYGEVTVYLNTDNATYGGYAIPDTLVFGPDNWSSVDTATIVAEDDFVDDGDDNGTDNTSFVIRLDNTTSTAPGDEKYDNGTVLTGVLTENVTYYALDNDTIGIRLVMIDNYTQESDNTNTGSFTVFLNSQPWPGETVTVYLKAASSSNNDLGVTLDNGTAGPSFGAAELVFGNSNWNTPQTITAVASDDPQDEGEVGPDNQTFQIEVTDSLSSLGSQAKYKFSKISGYGGGTDNVTFVVEDNDTRAVYVTVQGKTYTLDNASLAVIADNGTDNLTIAEDGTDNLTIEVSLRTRPSSTVTIDFSIDSDVFPESLDTDGIEEQSLSSYAVTFNKNNWNTPQTITVSANDESFDLDNKTLTLPFLSSSSDLLYSSSNAPQGQLKVIKIDNDSSGIVLTLNDNYTQEASVDGNTGNFTVVLTSKPLEYMAVRLKVDNTTAGVKFVSGNSLVEKPALGFERATWNVPQTVVFKAVDDSIDEGDNGTDNQTFVIEIDAICTNANNALTALQNGCLQEDRVADDKYSQLSTLDNYTDNITVIAEDNDTARVRMVLVDSDNATREGDALDVARVSVVLDSEPYHDVTVRLSSSDPVTGISLSQDSLVFGSGNWSTRQTVTAVAVDDDYDEGSKGW
ncbi:MAG: Ig-like domain-containing protein, partial [bacterium]